MAETVDVYAEALFNNISGWELSTLKRIGARVKAIGKMTPTQVKQLNNIAVVKGDMDTIFKELAEIAGMNIAQLKQIYSQTLEANHLEYHPLYDYRGKPFTPFTDSIFGASLVNAYAKTTAQTMINLCKTKSLGVVDYNGRFVQLQKAYTDILDKAVMQVTSGTTDFNTAMRDGIKALGGSGMRVDYGGGITRRLDTAVRQSLLWGTKQASMEYDDYIGDELGCDGIEIDWHYYPRPSHEFMQGKQYSLEGKKLIDGKIYDDARPALEALKDYNCRHKKYRIICGVSEPNYSAAELRKLNAENKRLFTVDGKKKTGYQCTQDMRKLETEARKQKTIREMARASGDTELEKQCSDKLKIINQQYKDITDITGIKPNQARMSIVKNTGGAGGNTGTANNNKTANAAKKSLTNDDNGGIINIHKGRQDKHLKDANNFTEGRSYLTISNDEIKDIIATKSGTGIKQKNIEEISADKIIGVNVNPVYGHKTLTDRGKVHSSKDGYHLVPTYARLKEKSISQLRQYSKKVAMEYFDTEQAIKWNGKLTEEEKIVRINALMLDRHDSKTSLIKEIKAMEKAILRDRGEIK